jgi:hypothetical protein
MNKGPARKVTVEDMSGALATAPIITPGELPMYRDGTQNINIDNINDNLNGGWGMLTGGSSKRKREKDRMDPRKSRRPELPVTGPGKGGRVGASATQHVVQHLVRDTTRDEDVSIVQFSSVFPSDVVPDGTPFITLLWPKFFLDEFVLITFIIYSPEKPFSSTRRRRQKTLAGLQVCLIS